MIITCPDILGGVSPVCRTKLVGAKSAFSLWMIIIIIIMIIIIALKGAIRDFYNLLTALRTVSNTYAQVAQVQSCANHVENIERLSCATCCVPLGRKVQLSYSVWQSWNRIYFSFILVAETINWWRRGGNRSTRRKPLTTSFQKGHILKPENSSPKRDSNPHSSIGGRLGKQTCWPLHHASPQCTEHTSQALDIHNYLATVS